MKGTRIRDHGLDPCSQDLVHAHLVLLGFTSAGFPESERLLQSEDLWQPCNRAMQKVSLFPIAFAHSVSLCHILVTLAISQTLLLLYLLW